jgi:S-adenosylmethionine-dependent methyltransferase
MQLCELSEFVTCRVSVQANLEKKMPEDNSDIADFYNSNPEIEAGRLDRHQLEFDLTWRYLRDYLPAQGAILEVGAATGRYTVELARRGYQVTAVDLSAALLERCRQNLVEAGVAARVDLVVADARNLGEIAAQQFDAVLLMGPLYHLTEEADRLSVLQAAVNRLRGGGLIVSAFLSRFGVISGLLRRNPQWIEDQTHVRAFLERGKRPDHYPRGGFRGYSAHASEIAPLHEQFGIETLVIAGIEPAIGAEDERYNQLPPAQRSLWLDLLYEISAEPSIIGASSHLLYIGKKPSA